MIIEIEIGETTLVESENERHQEAPDLEEPPNINNQSSSSSLEVRHNLAFKTNDEHKEIKSLIVQTTHNNSEVLRNKISNNIERLS